MAADPLAQVEKNTTTLEREVVIVENKTDITSLLTYEDIEKAYILHEQHWPYNRIAAHLRVPQGHVIRAVAYMQQRQCKLCEKCHWKKDGAGSCVLPPFFCTHRIRMTRNDKDKKEWMEWKGIPTTSKIKSLQSTD